MESFLRQYGAEGQRVKEQILRAFNSSENLTQKEIDDIWFKAKSYVLTLPEAERGGFYWRSGMEAFFLLTTESKE